MKQEKRAVEKQKPQLPKGFKIDPNMKRDYDKDPFFKNKIDEATALLKRVGIPKT